MLFTLFNSSCRRFKVNWKKLHKFHTDLDSNEQADMLNVKLTCE